MTTVLSLRAPRELALLEEPDPPVGSDQIRVRTLHSAISAGTELASYRGTNPYLHRRWDAGLRLFTDGHDEPAYPVTHLGYGEVGVVVEGPADLLGRHVWGTWGHRTSAVLDVGLARQRLISTTDPLPAVFAHIGAVALGAVLDAEIHLGETVVVFGAGVPGQLAAQMARLNGARVVVVDMIEQRRELALRLGAAEALAPGDGLAEQLRELTDGRGADVAIELSGSPRALGEAVRAVAYNSRVVASGFYQGGMGELRLGEEFHHNRIQLVCSQISGVPAGLQHRWDRPRLWSTAVDLIGSGTVDGLSLISHHLPPSQAAEAFTLLDQRPAEALQVVLDYTGETA